jgi:hypothetical protein
MSNDFHRTPKELIKFVLGWKRITLDPCADDDKSNWYAVNNITAKQDGLTYRWLSLTFANPPYSYGNLPKWTAKASYEFKVCNIESVLLVPVDPSTTWWQDTMSSKRVWCAVKKRIHFEGQVNGSPKFPSAFIYYGSDTESFIKRFSLIGQCHRAI